MERRKEQVFQLNAKKEEVKQVMKEMYGGIGPNGNKERMTHSERMRRTVEEDRQEKGMSEREERNA